MRQHAGWSAWATGCPRVSRFARTTILATLAILVLGWSAGAMAGEVDCNTLLKNSKTSSEPFQVRIETAEQMVRIEALGDHCYESIAIWARRDVPTPPRSKGRRVPVPSPKAARGTTQQHVAQIAPASRPTCDKKLGEFWDPQELVVEGTVYWLSRIFTIDTNNDGRTDDVGFILKAKGKTDLVVRYIRTIGGVSGRSVPALRLEDEGNISRLCFDQITFVRPAPAPAAKPFTPFKVPDLSRKTEAEPSASEPLDSPAEWWPEALGASIFLVFGFGSAGVLTRYCRSSPRRMTGDRRGTDRRGSGDRRESKAEGDGSADKRGGQRRKGDKRQRPERRAKGDRRRK